MILLTKKKPPNYSKDNSWHKTRGNNEK